jgi:hypothetical protein
MRGRWGKDACDHRVPLRRRSADRRFGVPVGRACLRATPQAVELTTVGAGGRYGRASGLVQYG